MKNMGQKKGILREQNSLKIRGKIKQNKGCLSN